MKEKWIEKIKLIVLRNYGVYLLNIGKVPEGRRRFEEALSIWKEYPDVDEIFKKANNVFTEMNWSQAEFDISNIEAAEEHIRKSNQILDSLPNSPIKHQLRSQVLYIENLIKQSDK